MHCCYIFLKKIILIFVFIILISCQLQEPTKNHGILFLENRSNQLLVNKTNKNDVIKIIGNPHTKSISSDNDWIYIERILTKGAYHKLGQNILKSNNVLVLTFDKFGVLKEKNFLTKRDINDLKFSKKITENDLATKSFVESFLSSIRTKMYRKRK
jgi:outer membrane protein assembly factor BamE (lipoprotein component of BamABCDE complex)